MATKLKKESVSSTPAIQEVHQIFTQIKDILYINREQSTSRKLFDMLAAIEDVEDLLNEAWKVSQLNNLTDDHMRKEFISMYDEFGKLKKDLHRTYIKEKH